MAGDLDVESLVSRLPGTVLRGCGAESAEADVALPGAMAAQVDRSWAARVGREVLVRLADSTPRKIT